MKVCIVGCSSMIGQNLIRMIKTNSSFKLYGYDICKTYNIDYYLDHFGYIDELKQSNIKFDLVIHLLSTTGPSQVMSAHKQLIEANINLVQILQSKTDRIIFTSSPEKFDMKALNVLNVPDERLVYPASKMMAEILIRSIYKQYLIVYPYNMFGPYFKLHDSRLPFSVVRCKTFNKHVKLFGRNIKRSFTSIKALEALLKFLDHDLPNIDIHLAGVSMTLEKFILDIAEYHKIVYETKPRIEDFVEERKPYKSSIIQQSEDDIKECFQHTYEWFVNLINTHQISTRINF